MARAKVRVPKNDPVKKKLLTYLSDNYLDSDEEIIDLYVETYRRYDAMCKELADGKMIMDYTNKAGATNPVKNPLIIEITKHTQQLANLLKSMGLTPSQRETIEASGGGDSFENF